MKYKLVLRYYGRADLKEQGKQKEIILNSKNFVIVPFPAPAEGLHDYIAVYELMIWDIE